MVQSNILLIMTDTQPAEVVGCYSGLDVDTTEIDRLAARSEHGGINGFAATLNRITVCERCIVTTMDQASGAVYRKYKHPICRI